PWSDCSRPKAASAHVPYPPEAPPARRVWSSASSAGSCFVLGHGRNLVGIARPAVVIAIERCLHSLAFALEPLHPHAFLIELREQRTTDEIHAGVIDPEDEGDDEPERLAESPKSLLSLGTRHDVAVETSHARGIERKAQLGRLPEDTRYHGAQEGASLRRLGLRHEVEELEEHRRR